ncbi:hypothetical protein Taro_054344 [Colocasia esculenta]|uniref:Uncharacterized protein n=1 Tax=Colocasia esculenta TaxID=4460 RepID=A0A843XPS5_COLES|nr:hypothetical protein [Colocasia esculenta]
MASKKVKVKLKLKLLVDKAHRKVLFAEAGKDVVDFLFSILALPVGDVVRLLTKQVASPAFSGKAATLTWKKEENSPPRKCYRCAADYFIGCSLTYYSDGPGATCPGCSNKMTTEMKYVPPSASGKVGTATSSGGAGGERGFVKGAVTYMVMDDLAVAPMSTISSITLLNKWGVKDVATLEERTVELDMTMALKLLKASLQSTTVLTDLFLSKKSKRDRVSLMEEAVALAESYRNAKAWLRGDLVIPSALRHHAAIRDRTAKRGRLLRVVLPVSDVYPPNSESTAMDGELKLKLLVDVAHRKVLFAEAGKEVVDFLFSMLALSLGDVVRLLTKQSMVGCLGSLYESVESLDDVYVEANQSKSHLLTPRVATPAFSGYAAALAWKKEENFPPRKFYRCADYQYSCAHKKCHRLRCGCGYFSDGLGAICPSCSIIMSTEMKYVLPPAGGTGAVASGSGGVGGLGGFVKGVVTYMVMDDLAVVPMSTISSITLLNKCGVKEVGSLEERTVDLDMSKAVEMLKASLQSTTVLTDVFLPTKFKREPSLLNDKMGEAVALVELQGRTP